MTSREALEILLAGYYNNANYQELIEAREKLEKDLKVLEILKIEAIIQEHYKKGYGRYYTAGIEEFFNKIKEWLENE